MTEHKIKFVNCISLGWYCGTAASMAYHALRSCSGPFDWFFSENFGSVLKNIEDDFVNFMIKDNLEVIHNEPQEFCDKKYGFRCNHDVKENFDSEYPKIYQKYSRRAERFMEMIKEPTCFIRAVRSKDEVTYIKENREYIYKIIKKGNCNNEIVFLLLKDMELLEGFKCFYLNAEKYNFKGFELVKMFDASKSFLKYIEKDFILEKVRSCNAQSQPTINARANYIHKYIHENNDNIEYMLKTFFKDINEKGIYIWGAGVNGVAILHYMLNRKIKIIAIIDNDHKKQGTRIEGIPIISFSNLQNEKVNIFISSIDMESVYSIVEQIKRKITECNILTWKELYENS